MLLPCCWPESWECNKEFQQQYWLLEFSAVLFLCLSFMPEKLYNHSRTGFQIHLNGSNANCSFLKTYSQQLFCVYNLYANICPNNCVNAKCCRTREEGECLNAIAMEAEQYWMWLGLLQQYILVSPSKITDLQFKKCFLKQSRISYANLYLQCWKKTLNPYLHSWAVCQTYKHCRIIWWRTHWFFNNFGSNFTI